MNSKFIIIVLGEPYSTFSEILGKYFTKVKKFKKKNNISWQYRIIKKTISKNEFYFSSKRN